MHPPKQRHTTGIILGVLAALLIAGVFTFLYRSQVSNLTERIVPRCFIGFQGTSASITVIGINAETFCQRFIQKSNHICDNRQNCTYLATYEMSSEPTQPEVCEGYYENNHLIIRDEGIFKLIGGFFCSRLFPSNPATPVPQI
jgi:hypothetical protein